MWQQPGGSTEAVGGGEEEEGGDGGGHLDWCGGGVGGVGGRTDQ